MAFNPTKAVTTASVLDSLPDNTARQISPEALRAAIAAVLNYAENAENADNITEGSSKKFLTQDERNKIATAVTQAEAEAGESNTTRMWSPRRVAQAIAALGGGGSELIMQDIQASDFTATAGRMYPCTTTGALTNVRPPASPSIGDKFGICDAQRSFGASNLVVKFNSSEQPFCRDSSAAADLILSVPDTSVVFEWRGLPYGWLIVQGRIN